MLYGTGIVEQDWNILYGIVVCANVYGKQSIVVGNVCTVELDHCVELESGKVLCCYMVVRMTGIGRANVLYSTKNTKICIDTCASQHYQQSLDMAIYKTLQHS